MGDDGGATWGRGEERRQTERRIFVSQQAEGEAKREDSERPCDDEVGHHAHPPSFDRALLPAHAHVPGGAVRCAPSPPRLPCVRSAPQLRAPARAPTTLPTTMPRQGEARRGEPRTRECTHTRTSEETTAGAAGCGRRSLPTLACGVTGCRLTSPTPVLDVSSESPLECRASLAQSNSL